MDINNLKGCIDHEEATIRSYMRDPEFAEYMLQDAITEGDIIEAQKIQKRMNEAKARTRLTSPNLSYWDSVVSNAKLAVQDGRNLGQILSLLNDAVGTVKAAML